MNANEPSESDGDELRRHASRSWSQMVGDAARGVKVAVRGEINFYVHLFIAAMAGVAGGIVGLTDDRWCLYILCVAMVLTAEMFNTAIEHLARAVSREKHPEIRDALDVASGAVLIAAIGAACVGALVIAWPFVNQLN